VSGRAKRILGGVSAGALQPAITSPTARICATTEGVGDGRILSVAAAPAATAEDLPDCQAFRRAAGAPFLNIQGARRRYWCLPAAVMRRCSRIGPFSYRQNNGFDPISRWRSRSGVQAHVRSDLAALSDLHARTLKNRLRDARAAHAFHGLW